MISQQTLTESPSANLLVLFMKRKHIYISLQGHDRALYAYCNIAALTRQSQTAKSHVDYTFCTI